MDVMYGLINWLASHNCTGGLKALASLADAITAGSPGMIAHALAAVLSAIGNAIESGAPATAAALAGHDHASCSALVGVRGDGHIIQMILDALKNADLQKWIGFIKIISGLFA